MKSLLSSNPALWFLFLFNLAVAVAVGFEAVADSLGLSAIQQIVTCVGMGFVALGAGSTLLRRRMQTA